jgi:hypothetical protein
MLLVSATAVAVQTPICYVAAIVAAAALETADDFNSIP